MARFLVVGGGVTGLSTALQLATAGHDVDVVERSSAVGGDVLSYCCKATDSCARCGVCVAHRLMRDALRHERVHLRTGSTIVSASPDEERVAAHVLRALPEIDYHRCVGCDRCLAACPTGCITRCASGELVQYRIDHRRCLLHQGKPCRVCAEACPAGAVTAGAAQRSESLAARACLVAVGHTPFAPAAKPRYGYGRSSGILTGREAEEILSREPTLGQGVTSVAFVQCVGSRDPSLGRPWCSAVCCAYAVRLARVIKHRDPSVAVTVYYIDLQSFDKCFTAFRAEVESAGVELLRGVPFRMDPLEGGGIRVTLEGNGEAMPAVRVHDRVVLSVGLGPTAGAADTARLLGIGVDAHGFLKSARENVLVAGTCARPQTIPECIAEAGAAASRLMALAGSPGQGGR
jgi:heterodisulfide reductase subunit A